MKTFSSFNAEEYRWRLGFLRKEHSAPDESQEDFARKIGIPFKTWNAYERGYPMPRETCMLLQELFGDEASADWIWYGKTGNLPDRFRKKVEKALRARKREASRVRDGRAPKIEIKRRRRRPRIETMIT